MTKKDISLKQISYAASTMIIATSILTKQLYTYAKNQAWLAVLSGFVFCLFMIGVYSALAKKFPGLSLIEINDAVYGPVLGKIISVLYIYFFLTIACLNVNVMSGFIKAYVLPMTPMPIITLVFVAVCGWAAHKGPSSLMSYGFFVTFISIVIMLANALLLIPKYNLENLLPVFTLSPVNYAIATHSAAMIPLSDTFFMIMFLPYVKKPASFGKALTKGLIIGALFQLVLVLRDTIVLGGMLDDFNMPSHISVRQIDVGDIVTRIDIVFISVILMLLFYKVSVLFYISVSGTQRLLKLNSHQFLVGVFTVLLTLYGLVAFPSQTEHIEWLISGAAAVQHTLFMVVLPFVTWLVAVLRGMGKTAAIKTSAG